MRLDKFLSSAMGLLVQEQTLKKFIKMAELEVIGTDNWRPEPSIVP